MLVELPWLNRAEEDQVMLVELPVVEQRYLAMREVLDTGVSITDVATRYGVDRSTLHRCLVRYASDVCPPWRTATASRTAALTKSPARSRR